MKRSWARTLALTSLAPLLAATGCDALTVNPFSGAVMQFTLSNVKATPAGEHLEVWARNANNDIIRLTPYYLENKGLNEPGIVVVQAVPPDSPCMIAKNGYLLTDPNAYPGNTDAAGIVQTPADQAQQVVNRINQLNNAGDVLLAVVPFTRTVPPLDANSTPKERLDFCIPAEKADPTFYVPQPAQVTAPINGIAYGFIDFQTNQPPANYNGFRLDVPVNLRGVQEIFMTLESVDINDVDPNNRGPLFITSTMVPGGRDIPQFTLHSPTDSSIAGAVSVNNTLDQDPVQF